MKSPGVQTVWHTHKWTFCSMWRYVVLGATAKVPITSKMLFGESIQPSSQALTFNDAEGKHDWLNLLSVRILVL